MSPRRRAKKDCPETGKASFTSQQAAEWGAGRFEKALDRALPFFAPHALYPYQCRFCPYWHLTHQEQRNGDRLKGARPRPHA